MSFLPAARMTTFCIPFVGAGFHARPSNLANLHKRNDDAHPVGANCVRLRVAEVSDPYNLQIKFTSCKILRNDTEVVPYARIKFTGRYVRLCGASKVSPAGSVGASAYCSYAEVSTGDPRPAPYVCPEYRVVYCPRKIRIYGCGFAWDVVY